MNTDDFLPHMPPHVRGDFIRAVARERMRADYEATKAELRGYAMGHEQGYWEAKDERTRR